MIIAVSTLSAPSALGADNVPSHVVNANSAKLLDVRGASNDNGAQVIQWNNNGGANQIWTFKPVGPPVGGTLQLYLIQSQHSKKVLDVQGSSKNDTAPVVQNDWSGAISQLWVVFQFGDTPYALIMNVNSAKVLDVTQSSKEDGANVVQYSWLGGANQLWSILDLGP
ncbi:MAG: RICIN domain-containing protein [Actinomycetota bacterium]|nr:RICIN domain-containing protein [Actinomycetota bacterium]